MPQIFLQLVSLSPLHFYCCFSFFPLFPPHPLFFFLLLSFKHLIFISHSNIFRTELCMKILFRSFASDSCFELGVLFSYFQNRFLMLLCFKTCHNLTHRNRSSCLHFYGCIHSFFVLHSFISVLLKKYVFWFPRALCNFFLQL